MSRSTGIKMCIRDRPGAALGGVLGQDLQHLGSGQLRLVAEELLVMIERPGVQFPVAFASRDVYKRQEQEKYFIPAEKLRCDFGIPKPTPEEETVAHRRICHEVLYNNLQTWRAIRDYLGG